MATFYFGGWGIPGLPYDQVLSWAQAVAPTATKASILTSLIFFLSFMLKLAVFLWIFIHVRWTLPRFRYDQLMDLGWKTMLPWALANTILTALIIFLVN